MRFRFVLATALAAAFLAPAAPALGQQAGPVAGSQADRYHDPEDMQQARDHVRMEHGGMPTWFFMLDKLETRFDDDEEAVVAEGGAWFGGDLNKAVLEFDSEYSLDHDEFEEFHAELLWSRAISPYWDFRAGLRHDFEPDDLTHLAVGFEGLAPYLLEVDAAAYLSDRGDGTVKAEIEHELLLTQRLILQPSVSISFSFQDIPERELESGFTGVKPGVRLRYEIVREFAPYVGVEWRRALGGTANLAKESGAGRESGYLVAGLRIWI